MTATSNLDFFLESELKKEVEEIDVVINYLKTKLSSPDSEDILKTVIVWERLGANNSRLKKTLVYIPEAESFLKRRDEKKEKLLELAKELIRSYLPREEAHLVQKAKEFIEMGNEREFRCTMREIENLDNDVGKIAYDNRWLTWTQRPWHVYGISEDLREEFVVTNSLSLSKIRQWETEDDWNKVML